MLRMKNKRAPAHVNASHLTPLKIISKMGLIISFLKAVVLLLFSHSPLCLLGSRQKTEKHRLEETVMDGNLDGNKRRRVSSPLDVTSVSSKADSVVSSLPGADTCHSPQETCRSLSVQPELRPPVSQSQRPIPELQVKIAEVPSESPSSSFSPKTSQTLSVSPRNECLPTRKRPAVTSLETLIRPDTNNPQLDDPLPAKHKCSHSQQPISQPSTESDSESTPVNPVATSTLLSPKGKEAGPRSDEQDDWGEYAILMAIIRKLKSESVSTCMSGPDNAGTTTSCADGSSQSGVERRWDVQTMSKMANKTGRWDSELPHVKATVKQNPTEADLSKMFSTAASVVSCENQLVAPNNSATEAKAVGIMFHSASTADNGDPQHQINVDAQSMFGNRSQFKPSHCVASNQNPGQIPQPQGHAETDSTEDQRLPINAIITPRPDPANQQFMGGENRQNPAEVNGGHQFAHSFSEVAAANSSDTLAASGQYCQYNQMASVTNGQNSSYLSAEAVAGYTTPDNPPVYNGSSYQRTGGYTPIVFYPSQIYPEQEVNRFGRLATPTPPGHLSLEMQQQVMQQQVMQQQLMQQQVMQQQLMQQRLMQQQLMQQQHYTSWTSAALAAGSGIGTNEAACQGAVPFNSSQMFINLNDYSTKRIAPTQHSNNMITQNTPQVYPNPPVVHSIPTTNSEVISQAPVNSIFASGSGFFNASPAMVSATPPFKQDTDLRSTVAW